MFTIISKLIRPVNWEIPLSVRNTRDKTNFKQIILEVESSAKLNTYQMPKPKYGFILAACFLSAAAAAISFASLATQQWVVSRATHPQKTGSSATEDSIKFGLFGGLFTQTTAIDAAFELTMVCLVNSNICALLCGDNMSTNLRRLYNNQEVPQEDIKSCATVATDRDLLFKYNVFFRGTGSNAKDRTFINAGIWVSTIIFLCLSAVMGVISSTLALWNAASSTSSDKYLNTFGLYIYTSIAFFSILMAIVLWGAMFALTISNNIPTYKTFLENFSTRNLAELGFSYWINLVSLTLYILSICLLYSHNYLMAKEQEANLHLQDTNWGVLMPLKTAPRR